MATIFNFLLDILVSTVGFFFKLIGGFIIGALTLKEAELWRGWSNIHA